MSIETSCSVCGQPVRLTDGVVEQGMRCAQCNPAFSPGADETTIQWDPHQPPPPLVRDVRNLNSTAEQPFEQNIVEVVPTTLAKESPRVRSKLDKLYGPARDIDLTYAKLKVRRSANALTIIAGVNLAIVLYRGLRLILWADEVEHWTAWHVFFGLLTLGPDLLQMGTSLFVLCSVGPMKRFQRYELSRLAAIAAMIPYISFNCIWGIPLSLHLLTLVPLLGIPIGWRAFVTLSEQDVAIAFGKEEAQFKG